MTKRRWLGVLVALLVVLAFVVAFDPAGIAIGVLRREPFFDGRPANWWGRALRDADPGRQQNIRRRLKDGGAAAIPVLANLLCAGVPGDWVAATERWTAAELLRDLASQAVA